MKLLTRILLSVFLYTLTAFGVSLSIKAGIGVASVNAFSLTIANITSIKVGTIVMFVNYLFIAIYIVLSKGRNITTYIVQFISISVFGQVLNLILYNVFSLFEVSNYPLQLLMLISGVSISGAAIGIITILHTITFPVETACHQLAKNGITSFMKARYGVDIMLISSAVIFALLFQTEIHVREGTLISMAIFSFMMHRSSHWFETTFLQTKAT